MGRKSRKKGQTDRRETHRESGAAVGTNDPRNAPVDAPASNPDDKAAGSASPPRVVRSTSNRGWRRWALRLSLVVLSPLLFFSLVEVGLRIGGYGYPTSFFLGPDAAGLYRTNGRFGLRFFPRHLIRPPCEAAISAKTPGTTRIFVLGSSAAMGTPDESYSFGRILEVMLRERYPGRQFEVVNGAMVAINSHVALEIARDCAAHEPDLFVVYMGNNEVIGPYGPGTVFQRSPPSLRLIRAKLWAKTTRLGQLVDDLVGSSGSKEDTPASWQGMSMFMNNRFAADDPRLTAVYDNYRRNLIDICKAARGTGAAVILSTVAVNLKDCPPLASMHRSDLSTEDLARWDSCVQAGMSLEADKRRQEALEKYEEAARIDDGFAELQFRLGRCLAAVGRASEASSRFVQARDFDVLRFRADTKINETIRAVAAERAADRVWLADAEQKFSQSDLAPDGIPGEDLFYEHVHFTFDGNYQFARAVLDKVSEALPELAKTGEPGPMPSRPQCADMLALTLEDEARMAKAMVEMTRKKPFTEQLDHAQRQAEAISRTRQLDSLAAAQQAIELAGQTYRAALAKAPNDYWLHRNCGNFLDAHGQFEEALAEYRKALAINPYSLGTNLAIGAALANQGKADEAFGYYRKALEIDPESAEVRNNLGNALANRGEFEEAIAQFREAVKIRPDSAEVHYNFGNILGKYGQFDEAISQYQTALEVRPDFAEAHNNLGEVLANHGRAEEAVTHFRKALEIRPGFVEAQRNLNKALPDRGPGDDTIAGYQKALEIKPDNAEAHNNLGIALTDKGQFDEAIVHYQKALEIEPYYAEAHNNLGNALAGRRQIDEAVAHYQKALRIKPDYAEAHNNLGNVLAGRGRIDEAITHYQKVLEIRPDYAVTHNNLGSILAGRGQIEEAIAHFQKALEIKPDYTNARRNLDIALSKRGKNREVRTGTGDSRP